MREIWKQPLRPNTGPQTVQFPDLSIIISAGLDPIGTACVWAEVETDYDLVDFTVHLYWTGESILIDFEETGLNFIGAFVKKGLMYHAFTPVVF